MDVRVRAAGEKDAASIGGEPCKTQGIYRKPAAK
jgi:hypothetical protein